MKVKELNTRLENMRLGMASIEKAFPGVFTEFEKMTLVLKIASTQALLDATNHLESIDGSLEGDSGESISDRIWQLTEAVEKL